MCTVVVDVVARKQLPLALQAFQPSRWIPPSQDQDLHRRWRDWQARALHQRPRSQGQLSVERNSVVEKECCVVEKNGVFSSRGMGCVFLSTNPYFVLIIQHGGTANRQKTERVIFRTEREPKRREKVDRLPRACVDSG